MHTNEYVFGARRAERLSHVFMVPGGLIDRGYSALAPAPGLIPIVATHEVGAAYMADGDALAPAAASAPAS